MTASIYRAAALRFIGEPPPLAVLRDQLPPAMRYAVPAVILLLALLPPLTWHWYQPTQAATGTWAARNDACNAAMFILAPHPRGRIEPGQQLWLHGPTDTQPARVAAVEPLITASRPMNRVIVCAASAGEEPGSAVTATFLPARNRFTQAWHQVPAVKAAAR